MNEGQRKKYMKTTVLPAMKKLFIGGRQEVQEHDLHDLPR